MTTKISTADLYDEHGDSLQVCAPIFRDFGGLDSFTGPIKILKAFENFQMTRSTLEADGKGHVLVIEALKHSAPTPPGRQKREAGNWTLPFVLAASCFDPEIFFSLIRTALS